MGDFIPSGASPLAPTSWMPNTGMGDFVGTGAMWPIPENSVLADWAAINYEGGLTGLSGLRGSGEDDCGCGCGGSCSGGGLGAITTDLSQLVTDVTSGNWSAAWTDITTLMSEPVIGSVPLWMIGGGVILVWALFFSGGSHSRYQRASRARVAAQRAYA